MFCQSWRFELSLTHILRAQWGFQSDVSGGVLAEGVQGLVMLETVDSVKVQDPHTIFSRDSSFRHICMDPCSSPERMESGICECFTVVNFLLNFG